MSWKRVTFVAVTALLLSLLLCFLAALLIRSSGDLVALWGPDLGLNKREVIQFSEIFGQLRNAVFRFPVIPSFLLSGASAWLISAIRCRKKPVRVLLRVVLSVLLILLLFLITLLLTNVNTIRLFNVLLSIIPVLNA